MREKIETALGGRQTEAPAFRARDKWTRLPALVSE